jgi:apolipoprotein N-acyltransferase
MRAGALAIVSGLFLVLAFPPYGWAVVTIPAVAGFLVAVELSTSPRRAALVGFAFGLAFFMALFPWIGELGDVPLIGLLPLALVEAAFPAVFAWGVKRLTVTDPLRWAVMVTGAWALMEALRERFPVGGFAWGMIGYPVGEIESMRAAARWIGVSGWSVLVVALVAGLVALVRRSRPAGRGAGVVVGLAATVIAVLAAFGAIAPDPTTGREVRVAIVQGSTPCPERCVGERAAIFERHLALSRTVPAGSVDFVVWPEGSTGFAVDPVLFPEIRDLIGAEARRIGAAFLVGGDRPVSETEWINANVLFDTSGEIAGEYRKQHPVPFGEYIPARPLFDWIPDLRRVPRDMIRGEGPVVFDQGFGPFGSVISFESSFSRYIRQHMNAGARLIVVATSQASYPYSTASDQLIGMTRMHAAEAGVDLIHSAVTGRSTFITDGGVIGQETELVESTVITGTVRLRQGGRTLYTVLGDWVQYLAIAAGLAAVFVDRRASSPGSRATGAG